MWYALIDLHSLDDCKNVIYQYIPVCTFFIPNCDRFSTYYYYLLIYKALSYIHFVALYNVKRRIINSKNKK